MLTWAVGAVKSGRGRDRDRVPSAFGCPLSHPEVRDGGWERPNFQPLLVVTMRALPQGRQNDCPRHTFRQLKYSIFVILLNFYFWVM